MNRATKITSVFLDINTMNTDNVGNETEGKF